MATAEMEAPADYFFVAECPLKETCTPSAWKKAACWGWSLEEARSQVVRHLMKSGHHQMGKDAAEELADTIEIEQAPYEEPRPSKRARHQGPRPTTSDDSGGASSRIIGALTALADAADAALAGQRHMGGPLTLPPMPPPGPPPFAMVSGGHVGSRGAPPGTVNLRIDIAQAAMDNMQRAVGSARHAQRLCQAAALGFGQEAEAIADARRAFMTAFGFEE